MRHYFSFDIESQGLFGRAFAVGWVIVDETGEEVSEGYLSCQLVMNQAEDAWVIENVLPALPHDDQGKVVYNCDSQYEMMVRFWDAWTSAKELYSDLTMVTDCPFPVEAGFLLNVVKEYRPRTTMEDSPFPILDVASLLHTAYDAPNDDIARLPAEEPAHNPVCDARQSVRIMLEVMQEIRRDRTLAIVHGCYGPIVPMTPSTLTYTEFPPGTEPAEFSAVTCIDGWSSIAEREDPNG